MLSLWPQVMKLQRCKSMDKKKQWQAGWILDWIVVKIQLPSILRLQKREAGTERENCSYEWRPGWFCETVKQRYIEFKVICCVNSMPSNHTFITLVCFSFIIQKIQFQLHDMWPHVQLKDYVREHRPSERSHCVFEWTE